MKKILVFVACFLLVAFAAPATAEVYVVNLGNNMGYVYDENYPDGKYYIDDMNKYHTYLTYAVAYRNDYDYMVFLEAQMYQVGKYLYEWQVVFGKGLVFIYFYRPVNGTYWKELAYQLSDDDIKCFEIIIKKYGAPPKIE